MQFCYALDPTALCREDQTIAVENGTAQIVNYLVVDHNFTMLFLAATAAAASPMTGEGASGMGSRSGVSSFGTEDAVGSLKFGVLDGGTLWNTLALSMAAASYVV